MSLAGTGLLGQLSLVLWGFPRCVFFSPGAGEATA